MASVSFAQTSDLELQPTTSTATASTSKTPTKLTQSMAEWDIDGDGELDEAELALKSIDKSKNGTLSKEQMYQLMTENLKTQRDLFKVKKVVAGLVAFTCLLALCNLGTSFAAAFLAKDVTSEGGRLTDAKTGKAMATNTMDNVFESDEGLAEEDSRQRRLACEANLEDEHCHDIASLVRFDKSTGVAIVEACNDGARVTIRQLFGTGHTDHNICPVVSPDQKGGSTKNNPTLTITKESGGIIEVKPTKGNYQVTGLPLSSLSMSCNVDSDCGANLRCEDNGNRELVCKGINLHQCTMDASHGCAADHACLKTGYDEAPQPLVLVADDSEVRCDTCTKFDGTCGTEESFCIEDIPRECDQMKCADGFECKRDPCDGCAVGCGPATSSPPIVEPAVAVVDTGECTCENDDACRDGQVCMFSCLVPDFPRQCVDQAALDQECEALGPGVGSTCGRDKLCSQPAEVKPAN